jgi:hypothetical protein
MRAVRIQSSGSQASLASYEGVVHIGRRGKPWPLVEIGLGDAVEGRGLARVFSGMQVCMFVDVQGGGRH